jgi:malate/lactate dehydrogenase
LRKKVTVIGAGNVGANCAVRIADKELADVVLVDVGGRRRARPPAPHGATDAGYLSQAHSPLARLSRPRRRTVSILRQNAAGVVVTRQRAAPAVSVPR